MPDHVHMMISIPPKYAMSQVIGFTKGKSVPKPVRDKVSWDGKLNTLTISAPLTEDEAEVLKASVTSDSADAAMVEAAEISRTTAIECFQTPAELGQR